MNLSSEESRPTEKVADAEAAHSYTESQVIHEPTELKLTEPGILLSEWKPDHTVKFFASGKDIGCFFASGKEIGCFDFGQSPATFKGDVDESARLFIDAVIRMWPNSERAAGVALKPCEGDGARSTEAADAP